MTLPPDEYGELLRRAMRAEADLVVPSPEGLNIIRDRIEQRGLRGIFWWRVGASLAGAVLVAGTVVMLIPELRTQVVESTGTSQTTGDGTQPPDTSSIQRPPANNPPPVIASPGPAQARPTPVATPTPTPVATPTPTRPKPCVSTEPTPVLIDPEPAASESCPVTETPPPTPPPTPSASPSPTPTASDCSGDECATAEPSETPTETLSPDSEASPAE